MLIIVLNLSKDFGKISNYEAYLKQEIFNYKVCLKSESSPFDLASTTINFVNKTNSNNKYKSHNQQGNHPNNHSRDNM